MTSITTLLQEYIHDLYNYKKKNRKPSVIIGSTHRANNCTEYCSQN